MRTFRVTKGVLPLPSSIPSPNRRPAAGETFTAEHSRFIRRSLANGDIVEVADLTATTVEKGTKP